MKKMINSKTTIIVVIIIILLLLLICLKPLFDNYFSKTNTPTEEDNTNKYSSQKSECEIKGEYYIKKYKAEYKGNEHEISLKMKELKDKTLLTNVYIDNNFINSINLGTKLSSKKINCDNLLARVYVMDSKYIGLIIGKYNKYKINYNLYVYDDNRLINEKGELIFTRAYSKTGEEKIDQNSEYSDLDDISFDGSTFEYSTDCYNGECKRTSVKYNGFTIDKKELEDEEEKIYPTVD